MAGGATRPWAGRAMHLIGVGGAGMSAYARAAHALGARVSGSDRARSPYLDALEADGVLAAAVGGQAGTLPDAPELEVFYSSAVPEDDPERVQARERGLPERPRADLLAELSALRRTIAVAGAHGKTTTSSMLVHALREAGMQPGWLVGSSVGAGLPNANWGEGEWLVVEADESDRSMLALQAEIGVVTNVELDHHATFASEAELREVFRDFLGGVAQAVIWDRPQLLALREGPVVAYDAPAAVLDEDGSVFDWRGVQVRVGVPGAHNAVNAAGALEAAALAGAPVEDAVRGIGSFRGAGRRFSRLGSTATGALVIDDYAHHPTEVRATLAAARTLDGRRVVAVFQPHLYSRTAHLARDFGRALAAADAMAVLDVYPARERADDHPGVSGLLIAEAAADAAGGRPVLWLPGFAEAETALRGLLEEGDVCVVMGAGDVSLLAHRLVAGAGDGGASRGGDAHPGGGGAGRGAAATA